MEILRSFWNAAVYFGTLYFLGVAFWQAAVLGIIVLVCSLLRYGALFFMIVGVALIVVASAVWLQILPPVREWPDHLSATWPYVRAFSADR